MHFIRQPVLLALLAAGALYPACVERNDIAREKKGRAGSGSGAASGSSGEPGVAGSDTNEGGSDGGAAVSGAGLGDAGEGAAGAGGERSHGDAAATILVVGFVVTPESFVGTSYVDGTWALVTRLMDGSPAPTWGGVGVALLPDGTGVGALRGAPFFSTATWDGEWSVAESSLVPDHANWVGQMASFPGGAYIAASTPSDKVQLNTYDAEQKMWTFAEEVSQVHAPNQPAVAPVAGGDPLVVYYNESIHRYEWVRKTGSAWIPPVEVPLMLGSKPFGFNPNVDLIARVGVDQVVGVFTTDLGQLTCSLFEHDTWSAPARIATDVNAAMPQIHYSYLAALSDGRVALAYWTQDFGIKVGFFDGSHWSEFKVVPGAKALGASPLGLSRGAPGAVVELLFSQQESPQYQLRHMRLTNEATWAWTPAELVDGERQWSTIAIAAGP